MTKKRNPITVIIIVVFFASVIGLAIWQQFMPTATLELAGQELYVQVAKYPHHQYKGLGGRDTLEPYDGMLFVYTTQRYHGIVMREMEFPIDIVWLDGDIVVDIAPNVPIEPDASELELRPYRPRVPATNVLELNAGWVEEYGVKIGDRVSVLEAAP